MGISIYNIKKWARMLTGNSEMHVHQTMGKYFVPNEVTGYFNNMTEKVLKEPKLIDSDDIPLNHSEQGDVIFPVTIFQYALGAYDLYLETKDKRYINKFMQLAEWAVDNQEPNGLWNNFGFIYPDAPYGSMCQGEGASVLVRAYKQNNDIKYLEAAKKAIEMMMLPMEKGGTAEVQGEDIVFFEFTNKPVVLNGWVFSIFGLYDLNIISDNYYKETLSRAIRTLCKYLPKFDNGYWSMYDLDYRISSPFYHDLHIAQLQALSIAFDNVVFTQYRNLFNGYKNKKKNVLRAFITKAIQKIVE